MQYDPTEAARVLTATPTTLRGLLGGLGPQWTEATEGPGKWTPREILAHLIDGEENDWMPRVRQALAGEPWTPYDPEGFRARYADTSLDALLDRFAEARTQSLIALAELDPGKSELATTAHHPEFGTVTVGQHLATWVAHDLSHLRQICRVLAKQYRDAVGPWTAYLPILSE